MTQSVELVLDDDADHAVRAEWERLADAGLPSQAQHTAASNRPHVTLAALAAIDPSCEVALRATTAGALPLELHLGAPAVFGRGPFVLVRLVVPTSTLLHLHARVAEIVRTPEGTNLSPGRWTPHVTLARRVSGHQLAAALATPGVAELTAQCVALRRWDGDARREWVVAGPTVDGPTDDGPTDDGPGRLRREARARPRCPAPGRTGPRGRRTTARSTAGRRPSP